LGQTNSMLIIPSPLQYIDTIYGGIQFYPPSTGYEKYTRNTKHNHS